MKSGEAGIPSLFMWLGSEKLDIGFGDLVKVIMEPVDPCHVN